MTGRPPYLVTLSGAAGLRAAQDIAATLRQALAAHDSVAIATAAMTSADMTTIQLLLAARKQAQAAGKSLALAAPPTGVLHDLLMATGCLGAQGQPLAADGDFWTSPTPQAEGQPA